MNLTNFLTFGVSTEDGTKFELEVRDLSDFEYAEFVQDGIDNDGLLDLDTTFDVMKMCVAEEDVPFLESQLALAKEKIGQQSCQAIVWGVEYDTNIAIFVQ